MRSSVIVSSVLLSLLIKSSTVDGHRDAERNVLAHSGAGSQWSEGGYGGGYGNHKGERGGHQGFGGFNSNGYGAPGGIEGHGGSKGYGGYGDYGGYGGNKGYGGLGGYGGNKGYGDLGGYGGYGGNKGYGGLGGYGGYGGNKGYGGLGGYGGYGGPGGSNGGTFGADGYGFKIVDTPEKYGYESVYPGGHTEFYLLGPVGPGQQGIRHGLGQDRQWDSKRQGWNSDRWSPRPVQNGWH